MIGTALGPWLCAQLLFLYALPDQRAPLVGQILDARRVRRVQDPEAEEMLEEQEARTMIGQAYPVPREALQGPDSPLCCQ